MSRFLLGVRRLMLGAILGAAVICASLIATPWLSSAQAQYVVAAEFREALSPHGRWVTHSQWGEVWLPDPVPADWRPYTRGRWVYTNEWGWYWQEADEEAAWGWVANHYGRWVHDPALGWLWVPGEEWGPAWVDWRYSDDYVGWSPMPPDGVIISYQSDPIYWSFVRPRYLMAPRVFAYLAPVHERVKIIKRTVVVDRHRHRDNDRRDRDGDRPRQRDDDRGNRHANRGIEPALIAKAMGKPIRAAKVEPAVVRGTKVQGAREVDLKAGKPHRPTVSETNTIIRPTDQAARPRQMGGDDKHRSVGRAQAPASGNASARNASPPDRRSPDVQRIKRASPPPTMRRSSPPPTPVVTRRISPPPSLLAIMERRRQDGGRQPNRGQAKDDRRPLR